jgi:mRNA interferase MazF
VVLSPEQYNRRVGLALFCPVTSQIKGYPFEALIPEHPDAVGVVLADQIKSFDWRSRDAQFISALPGETISAILQRVNLLLAE